MSRYAISVGPQKWWADKNLRSLRFNSGDSAYLSRTPATAGNRKTWTWAGWVKRSGTADGHFWSVSSGSGASNYAGIRFQSDALRYFEIIGGGYALDLTTVAVFRDYSAWYHIVLAVDTTQATPANRVKVYINNIQQSFTGSSFPSQDTDLLVNTQSYPHEIGSIFANSRQSYFSGYLADVHFIDGLALDPTSFGKFDNNGIWQPQTYLGDYGTNGFRLNFGDNTSTSTLGLDSSGQGNHWTSNNLSVTAGADNDSMVDHPVHYGFDTGVGGEVRGNYCTWNPLDQSGSNTLSNGNLDAVVATGTTNVVVGTIGVSSGKFYWEVVPTAMTVTAGLIGIADLGVSASSRYYFNAGGWYYYAADGDKYHNGSIVSYGASYAVNDVIGVALDMDTGAVTFYKNGVSQGVAYNTGLAGKVIAPAVNNGTNSGTQAFVANFGQRPFAHQAPEGFKALCTTNLPENTGITTSGTFTGNSSADGPFVYLNGIPTAMTINGNSVTFGTHADKLSNGFKVRNSTSSYNASGSNTFTISSTGDNFKEARAQENP